MKPSGDMTDLTRLERTDVDGLREAVAGRVIAPGEDGYDAARVSWQRRFDPRPAVIVEAAGVPDVAAAIRFARERDLPLTVQSTGHGTVRAADDGLLLKTGAMTSVEVDPARRVARVGAGTLWSDVIAAAAPHGLAPLSGSSPAGSRGGSATRPTAPWAPRSSPPTARS
jgi:FAD/FMN-containing dehydrogenase